MKLSLKNLVAIDIKIVSWVARHRIQPLTSILKLITYTATGKAWFGFAAVLWILNIFGIQMVKNQTGVLNALLTTLVAWVIGHFMKWVCKRKRPFQIIENFAPLVNSPKYDSFPSLHAASTTSFFVALLISGHPYAYGIAIWSALASFSRVYLGVHFLSDILGGILLGIFCGSLLLPINSLINLLIN